MRSNWPGTVLPHQECVSEKILQVYTIQALSRSLRERAIASIASFVAPGGLLLVVCRERDPQDDPGAMPWPLTRAELALFEQSGLGELLFEDVRDENGRHFRVVYEKYISARAR